MARPILTLALTAGLAALAGAPALASGAGCATCYERVVHPALYGVETQRVMVRAPSTQVRVIPAVTKTVAETVMVTPERKVWQVSRDAYGRMVGCWVTIPARYETRHRAVVVQPEAVVPVAVPGVYVNQAHRVLLQPARHGWAPIAHRHY